MLKGVMAFEENAEDAVIVDQGDENLGEGDIGAVEGGDTLEFTETAEAPIAEMDEAEGEVAEVVDSIDSAVEVADTLENVADTVETTIEEDGGLTEPAAQALEVAVEGLLLSVGFHKSKKSILATEGFKDKATRVTQTKLAVESIQEWAKKIWAAIEKSFQRLVGWVKQFLGKVLDASKRLEARANAIAAKAKAMKGKSAPNDTKISAASFGKVIHVGGAVTEEAVRKYVKVAFVELEDGQAKAIAYLEGVKNSIKTVLDKKGESAFQLTQATGLAQQGGPAGFDAPEGTTVSHVELGFGDKALYMVLPTDGRDAKSVGSTTAFIGASKGAKEFEGGDVAPMLPDTVENVATAVAKSMGALSKAKEALNDVNKFEKEILGAAKKIIAEDKDLSDTAKVNVNATAAATRGLIKLMSTSYSAVKSYEVKVGKALLDYGALSLKAVA